MRPKNPLHPPHPSQGPHKSLKAKGRISAYAFRLHKYRLILWLGLALLLAAAVAGLGRLELGVNTQNLFLQQSNSAKEQFEQKYRIGENIGIYIESRAGSLLNARQLERIRLLAEEIRELPFVRSVQSLIDLWRPGQTDSLADFQNFVARFPELSALHSKDWQSLWLPVELTPYPGYIAELQEQPGDTPLAEQRTAEDARYLPRILEQNRLQTNERLLARLQQRGWTPERLFAALLDELLQSYQAEWRIIPVGITPNSYLLERELSRDLLRVLSIAAIICLLCILVLLQRSAFAAVLCVVCNVALVFGGSGYLGLVTDKTFVMIPVLLGFASTISYCVHIDKSRKQDLAAAHELCAAALRENLRPLSFAAATTIVSLLSFIAVPIPMIRVAGLQSAMAVALSYLLSISLFCSLLPGGLARKKTRRLQRAAFRPIIHFARLCYRHRSLSLLCAAALLAGSLLLLPRLEVNLSTESILGTRFRYVQQLLQVSRSEIGAGGFYNIDLRFPDEPLQKKWLERIRQFEQTLRAEKLVKGTSSVTAFIETVQRLYRGSDEFLPSAKGNQQALLTWERIIGAERSRWYSEQSLRILVQVYQAESQETLAHMKRVEELARVFQLAQLNQYITRGLLHSLGLSLLCVAILLFVLLRSLRLGLVALVPNLLPVLFGGAAVVLLRRQLEFVSMTVGPMVIGLAVDDTIYFLGHIKARLAAKRHSGLRRTVLDSQFDYIVRQTLQEVAPALITTTWILCALFASLLLSNAANIRYMGLYTVIAMLTALFSNLFLAPILLRWAYTRKNQ